MLISHRIKIQLFANGVTNPVTSLSIVGKGKTPNVIPIIKKSFATFVTIRDTLLEIAVQN